MISEKHNNKKQAIIDAAISVMQQMGYEEIGIWTICDATQISIGTFYHYFHDKDELLRIILGNIDIYLTENIKPTLTSDSDAENLKNFSLEFARQTAITNSVYGRVLSSTKISLPSEHEKRSEENRKALYEICRQIIKHGQSTGEFTLQYDADDFSDKLITCLRGCSMDWARRNYSYDIEAYISSLMDIFCKALLA